MSSCFGAQWRGEDGVANSAFAGAVTGLALGLYQRDPNKMFIYACYGPLLAGFCKHYAMSERYARPGRMTYFEKIQSRRDGMHPETREVAQDGYIHEWLQPGLKAVGVKVPDSWEQYKH